MKVRALLDLASSTSFISERLTHLLEFPRTCQNMHISGVAGLSQGLLSHSIVQFTVSPLQSPADKCPVSAIVVPRVTCDLPVNPVTPRLSWDHLSGIHLANPDYGCPGRVDLLLGVDVFIASLMHGRWDLPALLPPLKPSLVGFWWVQWNLKVIFNRSLHIMYPSSLETICCANFGRSKRDRVTSISPQRNEQLCLISRRIIAVPKTVDLSSLFPGNLTILRWVSPVHEPSRDFSLLSIHCSRRANSRCSTASCRST